MEKIRITYDNGRFVEAPLDTEVWFAQCKSMHCFAQKTNKEASAAAKQWSYTLFSLFLNNMWEAVTGGMDILVYDDNALDRIALYHRVLYCILNRIPYTELVPAIDQVSYLREGVWVHYGN